MISTTIERKMYRIGLSETRKWIYQLATYQSTFLDHSNRPAKIVHRAETSLPPLYGYSLYFTHPDLDISKVDGAGLLEGIIKSCSLEYDPDCPIHLKLYCLPGATDEECTAHYEKEKTKHGDYHTQITLLQKAAASSELNLDEGDLGLPGFVQSYVDRYDFWHDLLFVLPESDWNADYVRKVQWNPVTQEEYEAEWMDEDDPDTPPNMWISPLWLFDENQFQRWNILGEVLNDLSKVPREEETNDAWEQAQEIGWTSWPAASA